MLPKRKPSREAQRAQARLPGPVRYRKPKGEEIEPRPLAKTRRRARTTK